MSSITNEDLAKDMVRLSEQLRHAIDDLTHIKSSVTQITAIETKIAELLLHTTNANKDIGNVWKKIDENRTDISDTDKKTDGLINKALGAMFVWTVMQGFVLGSIWWVFTHLSQNETLNQVQEQRINALERNLIKKE